MKIRTFIKISNVTIIFILFAFSPTNAETYYVSPTGDDSRTKAEAQNPSTPWNTINKAVSEADHGDIVKVMDDNNENTDDYVETIEVDKSLTIERYDNIGANPQIKASNSRYVFYVTANDVVIRGLDIYNALFPCAGAGIELENVSGCIIQNNRCGFDSSYKNWYGICLRYSDNNIVSANTCKYSSEENIFIIHSNNNKIINNECTLSYWAGIGVSQSSNNTFSDNICNSNSGSGIHLFSSSLNNTLRGNLIENNNSYGISINSNSTIDIGTNDLTDKGRNTIRNNDNGNYQVYNNTSNNINAYYNFWGYTTASDIDNHIWDDEEGGGEVYFDPWLDEDQSLPVELSSFTAMADDEKAILYWITESEVDNLGFNIYRSQNQSSEYHKINITIIPGAGSSSAHHPYEYTDYGLINGVTYWYKLEDINTSGNSSFHGPVSATPFQKTSPPEFCLHPNYPNPFNPMTNITYDLLEEGHVELSVYNIKGEKVSTLINELQNAGSYKFVWKGVGQYGERLPSGIYFIKIVCDNYIEMRKMTLIQ